MGDNTKIEWSAKMVIGRICWWIVMALPVRGLTLQFAGFYANDSGYSDYCARRDQGNG